jgi:hypothetical protein
LTDAHIQPWECLDPQLGLIEVPKAPIFGEPVGTQHNFIQGVAYQNIILKLLFINPEALPTIVTGDELAAKCF